MAFKKDEVAALLVACHRRRCICHRFCGTKIETHHIEQSDPPNDAIDNAILVCFECHAEIASYNPDHPRGRKFTPDELCKHKEQWLQICSAHPEALIAAHLDGDVGPLQALVDELEYNKTVALLSKRRVSSTEYYGALFLDTQLRRAIQEGMVAMLEDSLRTSILQAYVAMSRANQLIVAETRQNTRERGEGHVRANANKALSDAESLINQSYDSLLRFLGHEQVNS
jgi:hypothetical protein